MTDPTDKQSELLESLTLPYPYVISTLDQYYRITDTYEDKGIVGKYQLYSYLRASGETNLNSKKKMNILLTTFWEYPVVGGLQNYMTTLKRGLEILGHRVDIIAPNHFRQSDLMHLKKKVEKTLRKFFIERYGSCNESILKSNVNLYSYELLLRELDLEQYDIFHAQDRFTANILSRLNEYYQKPLFFTPHGFMTQRRLKFNLIQKGSVEEAYYLQIDKKAVAAADKVIMLCEVFRQPLTELGSEDEKLTVVYTGIDFNVKKREKLESKQDKLIVTCISRLGNRKGHKYLLEALSLIKESLENVDVLIVGDGETREQLENQVKSLGLHNVYFLGTRTDISALLSISDIYILPTISDTLPISIIEAMFGQQAIITTNVGGIPEIIQDQVTGLITEPGNSQELADKLLLLLKDSKKREFLAKNAKEFADTHLTVTHMSQSIEKIYQSFL